MEIIVRTQLTGLVDLLIWFDNNTCLATLGTVEVWLIKILCTRAMQKLQLSYLHVSIQWVMILILEQGLQQHNVLHSNLVTSVAGVSNLINLISISIILNSINVTVKNILVNEPNLEH